MPDFSLEDLATVEKEGYIETFNNMDYRNHEQRKILFDVC